MQLIFIDKVFIYAFARLLKLIAADDSISQSSRASTEKFISNSIIINYSIVQIKPSFNHVL